MITAVLRGARHMGSQLAAMLPRKEGGGCGIYFDAAGMQFVRMTCVAGSPRVRLDACGSAVLDDGMLSGSVIAKPEAVARRLEEMLERSDMSVQELQDDTIVLALPSHELQTQVVDYPTDLPPRAVQAWCERRAALLLPGDGGPDLRSRVGVTWADPGSHRLRLYACEAALVDDRIAVLEMAGLRVHAIDASHKAGRRAFLVARPPAHAPSPIAPTSEVGSSGMPLALLQVDAHAIDLAVFDGNVCVADIRERFDGVGGHPEALASVVRELTRKLPVAPLAVHLVAQAASPGELAAICDAVATMCGIDVHPYDPLGCLAPVELPGPRFQKVAQRTSLTVSCGLALRAMSMRGAPCE